MSISEDIIREVRERADIVEVVGRSVQLRKRGRNYIGLCPFHQEKTPSFNVSTERKSYYCFGCHASGDVFSFLQQLEGKNFPEAVRSLAEQVGVVIDEKPESAQERETRLKRKRMFAVLSAVHAHYQQNLQNKQGQAARGYFQRRQVSAAQRQKFALGFAGGRQLSNKELPEIEDSELVEAGLVAESDRGPYHRFAGRVLFPIRDMQGRVLGFGGRVFGPADDGKRAKYLNSPEGLLFHKSLVLYGLYEARQAISRTKRAIVVEGYLDVLALDRAGIEHAVAPCGTALTEGQARLLKRFASSVVLCFDGDKAGQAAWIKALPILLSAGLNVHLVVLPEGEDPDSLAQKDPKQLKELIAAAPLCLEYLIDKLAKAHGQTVEGRLKAVEILRAPLLALPAGIASELFIERAAKDLAIQPDALRRELQRAKSQKGKKSARSSAAESTSNSGPASKDGGSEQGPQKPAGPERIGQQERQIVRLFLEFPKLLQDSAVRELPKRLRSATVRLFLEQAIDLAKQSLPKLEHLASLIDHPALVSILNETQAGELIFAPDASRQALEQTCTQLWRRETERERAELLKELTDLEGMVGKDKEQTVLLQQLKNLNDHLRSGCPWLSPLDGVTQRADSSH